MNQEQLLDHVADLLKTEASNKPGVLLLVFDSDWKVLYVEAHLSPEAKVIDAFDTTRINSGLPPSAWLELSKKVWACKSSSPSSIKFPGLSSSVRGKPGRRSTPEIEPPKSG
jgi:hypothetical protein